MAFDMTLEPFAARVLWTAAAPLASGGWRELLATFAQDIARRAVAGGGGPVGHIKGIARPRVGGFLHVSAVAAGRQADVQGEIPDGVWELALDLNVLVYGLPVSAVGPLVDAAARKVGKEAKCSAAVETIASSSAFRELHRVERSP